MSKHATAQLTAAPPEPDTVATGNPPEAVAETPVLEELESTETEAEAEKRLSKESDRLLATAIKLVGAGEKAYGASLYASGRTIDQLFQVEYQRGRGRPGTIKVIDGDLAKAGFPNHGAEVLWCLSAAHDLLCEGLALTVKDEETGKGITIPVPIHLMKDAWRKVVYCVGIGKVGEHYEFIPNLDVAAARAALRRHVKHGKEENKKAVDELLTAALAVTTTQKNAEAAAQKAIETAAFAEGKRLRDEAATLALRKADLEAKIDAAPKDATVADLEAELSEVTEEHGSATAAVAEVVKAAATAGSAAATAATAAKVAEKKSAKIDEKSAATAAKLAAKARPEPSMPGMLKPALVASLKVQDLVDMLRATILLHPSPDDVLQMLVASMEDEAKLSKLSQEGVFGFCAAIEDAVDASKAKAA